MYLFTVIALTLLTPAAQAATFTLTDPQLRLGFHISAETESAHQPVIHLVFANVLTSDNAYLYGGWKHHLAEHITLETLLGTSLQSGANSPIVSLRLSGSTHQLFYWTDLEYSPLFSHNIYGYLTVAWMVGPAMFGVDTENWVNLAQSPDQPFAAHWSVGPQVSLTLGDHLFLEEALLWDGSTLTPRTYFHLSW